MISANFAFVPRVAGVTLIELLVVVAIVAILAHISVPGLSDIMKNNQSATRINELQTSLMFARSEAVKRNKLVVLCKSSNGISCQNSGSSWHNGWIVFVDENGSGSVDAEEDILSLHGDTSDTITLTFTPIRVTYSGNGLASQGQNGTYILCDDRGAAHAKGVIVSAIGRPRLATDLDNNGVVEDATGRDLFCL